MKSYFTKSVLYGSLLLWAGISLQAQSSSGFCFSSTEKGIWQMQTVQLEDRVIGKPEVIIDLNQSRQTFKGWGTCFNELGWDALNLLPASQQEQVMKLLFAPDGDLRFTIGRFSIGANDYARNWYSCNETDGDFEMKHFNIDRDKTTLIPYIQFAQKYNPDMTFWASPWSPPTWLKTNKHYANRSGYNNGLPVDKQVPTYFNDQVIQEPKYLQAYALYFSKFIDAYKEKGIPITTLMYQNEAYSYTVYPSCSWTPAGITRFHTQYLGPLFEKKHPEVELILGTMNTGSVDVFEEILKDPDLHTYVKGIGFQWEGGSALPEIARRHPEYTLQQTESECGSGTFDWNAAQHTFQLINHYLANGCEKYTYWNAILKDNGASTWGWIQNALIQVNSTGKTAIYTPEYYAMKHYSHFIEPGSVILKGSSERSMVLACRTPENTTVIVAGNLENAPRALTLQVGDKYLSTILPARSFNSFIIGNEAAQLNVLLEEASAIDLISLSAASAQKLTEAMHAGKTLPENTTPEQIQVVINRLQEAMQEAHTSTSVREQLATLITKGEILLSLSYPGKDALSSALSKAKETLQASTSDVPAWQTGIQILSEAVILYQQSENTSAEQPGNRTGMIQNPSFKTGGSTGWTIYNEANGGDFKATTIGGRSCWNNWSNNFTSMNVYQDIEGLAPGIYTVSCYAMCGTGEITNQHAYVRTASDSVVSPVMNIDNKWGQPSGWEKLTTTQAIVGNDGKLRMGFASTSGGGTKGWFCVTDFTLNYYGTDENILSTALATEKEKAGTLLTKAKLPADAQRLSQAIATASSATGYSAMNDALAQLKQAMQNVQNSNSIWNTYHNQTLPVAQSLLNTELDEPASKQALQKLLDRQKQMLSGENAATQTLYTCNMILSASLEYFRRHEQAEGYANDGRYNEEARGQLNQLLENQEETILQLTDPVAFTNLVRALNLEIEKVRLTQQPGENTDYTFAIRSAGTGDNLYNGVPDGWELSCTNGDGLTKTGRHYDGNTSDRYFDSYHPTIGFLYYTGHQALQGLPNGTYKLRCAGRTNGNGSFITAESGDEQWKQEIPNAGETGGSIWKNAVAGSPEKKANNGLGYGWSTVEIDNILVGNHTLTIGFTNDKYLTGKTWDGNWLSVDDYQLFYKSSDYLGIDRVESDNPLQILTGKGYIEVLTDQPFQIYRLDGSKIYQGYGLASGTYIIKSEGQVVKAQVFE